MGHIDLASQDQVYTLISAWISEVNVALAADPAQAALQIRRFALLPKELSAEDGLLTRTGKLRRTAVTLRFATLIDALYAGSSVAMVDHADPEGARGADTEVLGLKIGDARVVGGGNGRRAA
jgi:long-chain acyl-CoA synthetase